MGMSAVTGPVARYGLRAPKTALLEAWTQRGGVELGFGDAHESGGGVDVDPAGEAAGLVDGGRDDRGEMDDDRRCDVGDQAGGLVLVGQICPPDADTAR